MDVLLQAARVESDCAALRAAAQAVTDWDAVAALAGRHALTPLLYSRLKTCCPEVVPADVRGDLQRKFHANTARNLLLAAQLRTVLGWLQQADVPAIAFKGPSLAALAYGDISLREFVDLDVLVRPADRDRAVGALLRAGCAETGAAGAGELKGNCEIGLQTPSGTSIDLHWEISPPYFPPYDFGPAWERVEHVDVGGTKVPTFGADDLFACLALHGARHCWTSLGWVSDIARLAAAARLEWGRILAHRPTRRMMHVAMLLAFDMLSAPVPAGVIATARNDHVAASVAEEIAASIFDADAELPGRPAGVLMHLRMIAGASDKMRYLWRRGVEANQTDNDFLPLPPALRPLLYLVRPFRMLGKVAGRAS